MARTGIVLYHGVQDGRQAAELARTAEAAGLESLWVTERYFHEETFALLGYLGAATQRIKLGVGVVNPYTRHPALLAMGAATLDRLTGGRFVLGLGRSEAPVVQGRMGLPYRDPLGTLEETVGLLRHLLAGEKVSGHHGRIALDAAHLEARPIQPRLPIYLAAIGPRALRLAGAVADGVLLNAYVPSAYVRWAVGEVATGARQAGRDPKAVDVACMLPVRLTERIAEVRSQLKRRIARLLAEEHVGELLLEKGGFDGGALATLRESMRRNNGKAAEALVTDAMVEAFYVVGSAERCRARVQEYRQAGVDLPLLLPLLEDYPRVVKDLAA